MLITFLLVLLLLNVRDCCSGNTISSQERSFKIDYNGNTFLKDGKPFRFIAGSLHYFRSHPDTWPRKLRTLRASGLNAVTTYVEWSLHNPKDGSYKWDGFANIELFLRLANEEDLLVILRPGPYICAERDWGGFPYWLLRKYPNIRLRDYDLDYMREVQIWYNELLPKLIPFLYENGGPIIMVQVENEYGCYYACNRINMEWMRDLILYYVGNNTVLFSNDLPTRVGCSHVNGVLSTLDFGVAQDVNDAWSELRQYQPNGPLVNAEFYPGWFTHWQANNKRINTTAILTKLTEMLDSGANVNFYMFHGGTNFGFTAGANFEGPGLYDSDVTSYDYDAPMDESGDPTPKYFAIREVISRYLPLPNTSVPMPTHKENYGIVKLTPSGNLLSLEGRKYLSDAIVTSEMPLSFEALDQFSGLVLYETNLPILKKDPSVLRIEAINDRGYVYVDREFIGVLSRQSNVHSLPIRPKLGSKLEILVENQGRINSNILNDFKGIVSDVKLDNCVGSNPVILRNWTMTKFSFENPNKLDNFIQAIRRNGRRLRNHRKKIFLRTGPIVFHGEWTISANQTYDTYLNPTGWGKGIAFINGFNLGRYWPLVGPQVTLYVPKEILKLGVNRIALVEYQMAPDSREIRLVDVPNLSGIEGS